MNLVFASQNHNKLLEIRALLPKGINLLSLKNFDFEDDIPETGDTLAANARQKARFVSDKFIVDCFAEDTGLEVDALNGEPGVYSARYAGDVCSAEDNMLLLLKKMENVANRSARFKTVICLIISGTEYLFEGIVNGKIAVKKSGTDGFGYDPLFIPDGFSTTFAEMPLVEKNKISHRSIATKKLLYFLNKIG